jgi:acetyl esterase/lipase
MRRTLFVRALVSLAPSLGLVAAMLTCSSVTSRAQSVESLRAAVHIGNTYRVSPNVTYLKVGGLESKLDVYQTRDATTPRPTIVWIHGGNWVGGSKEASLLTLLPFFDMGWNVVNVDYRLLAVAPAPAAAEDCRCALKWIVQHATDYNIDTSRIVVSGNSAGGHLSLLVAMADASAGFDGQCPGPDSSRVAAVINWNGFPDLTDLVEGKNMRPAVVNWLAQAPMRIDLARRLSPITYVRPGVPPVLTVHGDADPTSPYEHAVRLHEALQKAGVANRLVTVPGGKHGGFSDEESMTIYAAIRDFLRTNHVSP